MAHWKLIEFQRYVRICSPFGEWFGKKSQVPFLFALCHLCVLSASRQAEKPCPGNLSRSRAQLARGKTACWWMTNPPKFPESLEKICPFLGYSDSRSFFFRTASECRHIWLILVKSRCFNYPNASVMRSDTAMPGLSTPSGAGRFRTQRHRTRQVGRFPTSWKGPGGSGSGVPGQSGTGVVESCGSSKRGMFGCWATKLLCWSSRTLVETGPRGIGNDWSYLFL